MLSLKRTILTFACLTAFSCSWAQEITADEMMQLDNLRAQYKAQGKDLSPEDEVRLLQRLRAMKAVPKSVPATPAVSPTVVAPTPAAALGIKNPFFASATPEAPVQSLASQTEDEIKRRLAALGKASKPIENLTFLKDGVSFDGKRFADPEGRASRFAVDQQSARIGYVVSPGVDGGGVLKISSLASAVDAVAIGRVRQAGNQWQFDSVTGKSLSGQLFFPLTDGVLVMRDSVGFRYVAGQGVKQVNIPDGWFPTSIQRGNISVTGWLLLEKDNAEEKKSPLGLLSNMGKMLGVGAYNEYALMNIETGQMVEINVNNDGKNAYSYSQCHRKNGAINYCDRVSSYESIFNPDGSPNPTHYFWRINWMWTSSGPVLLAKEGNLGAQVNAWNLNTGKKVNLFERTLGVNSMTPRVLPDGRLNLTVQLGFSSESMNDVGAEIEKRPDMQAGTEAKPNT